MKFVYKPAADETYDPEYMLVGPDGWSTGISIQDCRVYGGGYAVQHFSGEGDEVCLVHLGAFKTLKAAKIAALRSVK